MAHFIITNVKKMRTKAIKNLKAKVLDTLRKFPQSRDSDVWLTLKIWTDYFPTKIKRFPKVVYLREQMIGDPLLAPVLKALDEALLEDGILKKVLKENGETEIRPASMVQLKDIFDLPREDNIKRIRAKIQNEEHRYLPTTPEIRKQRQISELDWRAWSQNQDKLFS